MSSYNYAFGNPATLTDPTGMAPLDWLKTKSGKIKYNEDVQSRADLKEGQTYLGENVLVQTKSGGAQLLTEGGDIKNVFKGSRFNNKGQEAAFGLSGLSAVTGKSKLTLDAAEEAAGEMVESFKKLSSVAGGVLSIGSVAFSATSTNTESSTYRFVKGTADVGFALGGFHPAGAIGGFALDAGGAKSWAVEAITLQILKPQVDETLENEERLEEE